jgi:hypothetical protein
MKITSDLTNLTTAILILTVQMFIEWTLGMFSFPDFFATNCNCCPFYFLFISGKLFFFFSNES